MTAPSATVVLVLCCASVLPAQQATPAPSLTLAQAVQIALEKNPQRKAALAETKAASADVKEAQSLLLPRIMFSETVTRGNDPVYVFGSKLRQQGFTTADFALNTLNTPTPFSNFWHAIWRHLEFVRFVRGPPYPKTGLGSSKDASG